MSFDHHADTMGAVCGQLVGAYCEGETGIPAERWDGLVRRDMIEKALRGPLGGCELMEESEK